MRLDPPQHNTTPPRPLSNPQTPQFMPIHPISIIIADAHIIPRNGLAKTLEAREDIHIAAITGDDEALISLCSHHQPDIIMISAAMPGINNTLLTQIS